MQDQPLLQESQDQPQTGKVLVKGGGHGWQFLFPQVWSSKAVLVVDVSGLLSHETNRPDFDAKFLVCAANIHGSEVYNGQAGHVLRSVFKDGLAHIAVPLLEFNRTTGEWHTQAV